MDLKGTLRYNATTNQWELSNNGGPFDPITTGLRQTSSAVQVRQTGAFSLASATYVDITFDTTDIETNTTALQHNLTTTSKIDVKETGLYLISYNLNLDDAAATGTWNSQVLLNGLTPINGSVQTNSNYQGEYSASNPTFYANLTAGDYITLQAQRVSANTLTKVSDPALTIIKMEGIKGSKGDQGLPGSVGLGTNSATFTLDQDNIGAGVNTDLISNQGTGLDGILRYNSANSRWQISGNGGTTFNDIHQASVFDAYDNAGLTNITTTQTVLNLDTTRISDPAYTLATNVVTFNETGLYKLTGRLSATTLDLTGATRSQMQLRFQQNISGSGMINVPGAYCVDYIREQASTTIAGGSCSVEWIGSFNSGDQVQLTHRMSGTTTGQTLPQGSGLTIEKIR